MVKYQDIYTLIRCKSRKAKAKLNNLMDAEVIADDYIRPGNKNSLLEKILKVCNLTPLPQLTTRNELKKRLKI